MTARKNDKKPEPTGGRAAERLREFEDARRARPPAGKQPPEETEKGPTGQPGSEPPETDADRRGE